jgi:hypothetical protein
MARAPADPLKSYANWLRRNQPSLIKDSDWGKILQFKHPQFTMMIASYSIICWKIIKYYSAQNVSITPCLGTD